MKFNQDEIDQIRSIPPSRIESYMELKGWKKIDYLKKNVAIYEHEEFDERIQVPEVRTFGDYVLCAWEVISKLGKYESRDPEEILSDLTLPGLPDVFRARFIEKNAEYGRLPIDEGFKFLNSAKRLLQASAYSIYFLPSKTVSEINRNVKKYISRCQIGQTEKGSYIIQFICPSAISKTYQTTIEEKDEKPFITRQITTSLMERVNEIVENDENTRKKILSLPYERRMIYSGFCHALAEMKPKDPRGEINLDVVWAGKAPQIESPPVIRLRYENFSQVERFKEELENRPEEVITLTGGRIYDVKDILKEESIETLDIIKKFEVTLYFEEGPRLIKVRARLPVEEREKACEAHMKQFNVNLTGRLIRGPKINTLEEPTNFTLQESDKD